MKVTINHGEHKTGLIRKTTHYTVEVAVEFNNEELAIIEERNLMKVKVMQRDVPSTMEGVDSDWDLTVSWLKKGDIYYVRSLPAAKQYDHDLREALKKLKTYLTASTEIEEKSSTFEL